jgi:hypothetical protein
MVYFNKNITTKQVLIDYYTQEERLWVYKVLYQ